MAGYDYSYSFGYFRVDQDPDAIRPMYCDNCTRYVMDGPDSVTRYSLCCDDCREAGLGFAFKD